MLVFRWSSAFRRSSLPPAKAGTPTKHRRGFQQSKLTGKTLGATRAFRRTALLGRLRGTAQKGRPTLASVRSYDSGPRGAAAASDSAAFFGGLRSRMLIISTTTANAIAA